MPEPIDAETITAQIREAAFAAWQLAREDWQDSSRSFFDRAYLGHFVSVDHYVETLVDGYELDAKLDAEVAEPFREFVDIDVTALARSLVRHGSLYTLTATPIGVWVFNGDIG